MDNIHIEYDYRGAIVTVTVPDKYKATNPTEVLIIAARELEREIMRRQYRRED